MLQKIVLVGSMGAGKSTIGRLLAAQLSLPFYDSDQYVEEKTGADIPWIFDVEGEEGFRDRESHALKELMAKDTFVLATGGGIVLKKTNRELLVKADIVIYLTSHPDSLVERTAKDKKRPLLQVADPRKKIIELIKERDPLYKEVATHTILSDDRGSKVITKEIVSLLSAIRL